MTNIAVVFMPTGVTFNTYDAGQHKAHRMPSRRAIPLLRTPRVILTPIRAVIGHAY
jgi:hypothetical protein